MSEKDVFMRVEELGELYLYDVLLEYIYPRVFVCEDVFDGKYLFYEMSTKEDRDVWLVTKITKKEYYSMVDRKKAIQTSYEKKRYPQLFSIIKQYGEEKDRVELSKETKNLIAKLPKEPVFSEKEMVDDVAQETLKSARETGAATLDIRLYPGTDRHFVPQNVMSELCGAMSTLTGAVFGKRRGEPLHVATAAGSCIVRFSFPEQINLFNETNADKELNIINEVLSSEPLSNGLGLVKDQKRFINSYIKMLDCIRKTNSDVQFTTAYPNSSKVQKIDLSNETVKMRYEYIKDVYKIEKETIGLKGTLIALDIKARRFKFQTEEGAIKAGFLANDFGNEEIYEIPKKYDASIVIEKRLSFDGSSYREEYYLCGLK